MYAGGNQACSLCRAPIPQGFFERPELLQRTRSDLASSMVGVNNWQWFYQSRGGGWWKFEERNNQDIEDAFHAGQEQMDTLICGNMYTVDFVSLCQFNRDDATRKRRIKRDSVLAQSVGVAGMVLKLGE
jgi:E3 ubiquitin-protein ligase RNF146